MKFRFFARTLIPFVFVSNLFYVRQSHAKPSPIFEPVIQEIESRLPSGLRMRLPAVIPTSYRNKTLYSFLHDDDTKLVMDLEDLKMEFFTVLVADTPDCSEEKNPENCLVAAVGVTEDPIKSEAELDALIADYEEDATSAEFERGIKVDRNLEGFYFAEEDYQIIIWRQTGMAHLLMSKTCSKELSSPHDRDCISQQQLIEMARSAAKEPVINSSDTSYYSY